MKKYLNILFISSLLYHSASAGIQIFLDIDSSIAPQVFSAGFINLTTLGRNGNVFGGSFSNDNFSTLNTNIDMKINATKEFASSGDYVHVVSTDNEYNNGAWTGQGSFSDQSLFAAAYRKWTFSPAAYSGSAAYNITVSHPNRITFIDGMLFIGTANGLYYSKNQGESYQLALGANIGNNFNHITNIAGIKNVSGTYIYFIARDTLLQPTKLNTTLWVLNTSKLDARAQAVFSFMQSGVTTVFDIQSDKLDPYGLIVSTNKGLYKYNTVTRQLSPMKLSTSEEQSKAVNLKQLILSPTKEQFIFNNPYYLNDIISSIKTNTQITSQTTLGIQGHILSSSQCIYNPNDYCIFSSFYHNGRNNIEISSIEDGAIFSNILIDTGASEVALGIDTKQPRTVNTDYQYFISNDMTYLIELNLKTNKVTNILIPQNEITKNVVCLSMFLTYKSGANIVNLLLNNNYIIQYNTLLKNFYEIPLPATFSGK
ncbi:MULTISPECIES: hypothetical protein [Cysteiniphilum]|uniref:Uncharacterized protein n=1 Tax=Cysteiniphilum litorale TaxID=2056700 RepID=A0A8J2Z718_9GAMM|nr:MULTISPECIES: hypothetical protein [Cysteiniphilum]GGG08053.1 hypothetical protein GCM10010995_27010 [Cysteiniphilum litorale]